MKRILAWIGVVVLGIVLALAGLVFASFRGLAPIVDGQTFEGVQVVKDGIVACYLVDLGPGEVALVDACNDTSAEAILAALSKRGLGADAVKAILLTHGDPDHIAAVPAFPAALSMALAADVPLAEGRMSRFLPWLIKPRPSSWHVGRSLADGELLRLGDVDVQVFAVPGHTDGSAAFLARGVLFMGDSAETTSAGALAPGKRLTSNDPGQNRASLKKLAQRLEGGPAVRFIAPSHSGVLEQGLLPLSTLARAL